MCLPPVIRHALVNKDFPLHFLCVFLVNLAKGQISNLFLKKKNMTCTVLFCYLHFMLGNPFVTGRTYFPSEQ